MALNSGKLAGKTAFISGASRGIGRAIALKFARDGANVVIAAKTATAHPKLPGTIYTTAAEVESAGGRALPCIVDIREEDAVRKAVDDAVKTFGGIDILVNNASAISLTGTLETPMKKYDLMNSINARGTYLCSQACLPYLKQSKNGHILNISPPLSMHPVWFKNHTAYTIAKFGMSMCVLGMAEEFREAGVAVNALWPRTAIATAAVEMLGGEDLMSKSRKPEIMSDAAYAMVTRNSRNYTGKFMIDDDVLKECGITNLDEYSWVPGAELAPDYFIDESIEYFMGRSMGTVVEKDTATSNTNPGQVQTVFDQISTAITPELCDQVKAVYMFELTTGGGEEAGSWVVDMKHAPGGVSKDQPSAQAPTCTLVMDCNDFIKMFKGELNSMQAFMSGSLKIKGDMAQALKLEKLMKSVQQPKSKL